MTLPFVKILYSVVSTGLPNTGSSASARLDLPVLQTDHGDSVPCATIGDRAVTHADEEKDLQHLTACEKHESIGASEAGW
jgi:hypothetical protein